MTTHRMTNTPEHKTWVNMRARCRDENAQNYDNYGGAGVTVCRRWDASFKAFYEDMGPRPSPEHSIDRIDPFGNYEPGNRRWATRREQAMNRRAQKGGHSNGWSCRGPIRDRETGRRA